MKPRRITDFSVVSLCRRLLSVMGALTPEQRCKVFPRYKQMFDKNLVHHVRDECGNRAFGAALQILGQDPLSADCHLIAKACDGTGCYEYLVVTIICGRTNEEMKMLKKKWFDWKTEDIVGVLSRELRGGLEQLVMNVLQAREETYDPNIHTRAKMEEECEKLHEGGIERWGTDEKGLFKVLCASPPQYMKELNMCFAEKYGVTLAKSLEKELSGFDLDAALFLMGMKINPYEQVAKVIDRACRGAGTRELLLSATLIRYHSILKQVDEAHKELYNHSIRDRVKSETSDDYEKLLFTILDTAGI